MVVKNTAVSRAVYINWIVYSKSRPRQLHLQKLQDKNRTFSLEQNFKFSWSNATVHYLKVLPQTLTKIRITRRESTVTGLLCAWWHRPVRRLWRHRVLCEHVASGKSVGCSLHWRDVERGWRGRRTKCWCCSRSMQSVRSGGRCFLANRESSCRICRPSDARALLPGFEICSNVYKKRETRVKYDTKK